MRISFTPKSFVVKFLKANLKVKISIYYITILCISIAIVLAAYSRINSSTIEKKTSASVQQTLAALDQNINNFTQNVSQCSDYMYFDDSIQEGLRKSHDTGIDPSRQSAINKKLMDMILLSNYISSIYLFDNYNNVYSMSKLKLPNVLKTDIKTAKWYDTVAKANGSPVWIADNGEVLEPNNINAPISLMRIVYDVDTYKPIGTLMINLNKDLDNHIFGKIGSQYKSQFFIVDDQKNYITMSANSKNEKVTAFLNSSTGNTSCTIEKIDDQQVMLSSMKSKYLNWRIVGIMPMSELSKQIENTGTIILTIMVINIVFLFIGQTYVTNLITKPLTKMEKHMTKVQNGNFEIIPVKGVRNDEIVRLKCCFNSMMEQIQNLIRKVTEEQNLIRLNELKIIRAQVNPHFLYNTLDAISALTLIKDCDGAYTLTQALGNFYRISLSSGRDIITVQEEIKCIENYVMILNIRYKNSFDVKYEMSEEILSLKILKLILQPFVENSILHGIHNKYGRGLITIKGYEKDGMIHFEIADNGVGMSKEKIEEIMRKKSNNPKEGFGIYSSITRISLFYNTSAPLSIESGVGEGTKIMVRVPVIDKEDSDGQG